MANLTRESFVYVVFVIRACQIAANDIQGTSRKEMSHFTCSHNLRSIKYMFLAFKSAL